MKIKKAKGTKKCIIKWKLNLKNTTFSRSKSIWKWNKILRNNKVDVDSSKCLSLSNF